MPLVVAAVQMVKDKVQGLNMVEANLGDQARGTGTRYTVNDPLRRSTRLRAYGEVQVGRGSAVYRLLESIRPIQIIRIRIWTRRIILLGHNFHHTHNISLSIFHRQRRNAFRAISV